jgi:Arg-Lys translocation region protein phosphatase
VRLELDIIMGKVRCKFLERDTNNPRCDFVDVIETENGYLCVLAGFENLEILESIYKYRLLGIFSLVKGLYNAKEEEILLHVNNAIRKANIENLNLSLLYISNTSNHINPKTSVGVMTKKIKNT